MRSRFRRYEILLPLKFNDGSPVPDELVGETLHELRREFDAVSSETQVIRGQWVHEGQTYLDELLRVFLDIPDTPETRAYFKPFKRQLVRRFSQVDIWIISFAIRIV